MSLARKPMQIPADLAGEVNLVFVAFLQDQQFTVNRWLRRVGDLDIQHDNLEVYEIPLLRRYPAVVRQWIDGGMGSGIGHPQQREHTITVYTDRKVFLRSVGLTDVSQIWTVLVDRRGTIFWSHVGNASDEAEQSLRRAVNRLA